MRSVTMKNVSPSGVIATSRTRPGAWIENWTTRASVATGDALDRVPIHHAIVVITPTSAAVTSQFQRDDGVAAGTTATADESPAADAGSSASAISSRADAIESRRSPRSF